MPCASAKGPLAGTAGDPFLTTSGDDLCPDPVSLAREERARASRDLRGARQRVRRLAAERQAARATRDAAVGTSAAPDRGDPGEQLLPWAPDGLPSRMEERLSEVELSLTRLAGDLGTRLDAAASSLDAHEAAAQSSADFMRCMLAEVRERLPTRTATQERATQAAVPAANREFHTDGGMEADQAAGGAAPRSAASRVADSTAPPPVAASANRPERTTAPAADLLARGQARRAERSAGRSQSASYLGAGGAAPSPTVAPAIGPECPAAHAAAPAAAHTPGHGALRLCSGCAAHLPCDSFSKSQWRKSAGQSVACTICMHAGPRMRGWRTSTSLDVPVVRG